MPLHVRPVTWSPAPSPCQIVRKYARQFVMCKQCRRGHTTLRHDTALRLDFLDCSDCHASRYCIPATVAMSQCDAPDVCGDPDTLHVGMRAALWMRSPRATPLCYVGSGDKLGRRQGSDTSLTVAPRPRLLVQAVALSQSIRLHCQHAQLSLQRLPVAVRRCFAQCLSPQEVHCGGNYEFHTEIVIMYLLTQRCVAPANQGAQHLQFLCLRPHSQQAQLRKSGVHS